MRILASCPRAYRTLACGADVPETCHPAAGHTAGETDPVLAGIRSRSLRVASIDNVPGAGVLRKEVRDERGLGATSTPVPGHVFDPWLSASVYMRHCRQDPGSCKT
jgi:hypothetical protein